MNKKKKTIRRLQIQGVDGTKRNLGFTGITRQDTFDLYRTKFKSLVQQVRLNGEIATADQKWIAKQDNNIRKKLVVLGVLESKDETTNEKGIPTIYEFVNSMLQHETKPTTKQKLTETRDLLVEFFTEKDTEGKVKVNGKDQRLDDVTKGDALRFVNFLTNDETGKGYAPHSTARRYIGYCRQIWNAAIADEILPPTRKIWNQKGLKATVKTNPNRHHYISPEIRQQIFDSIQDDEGKLRFVLLAIAGLRSPSELNALKWSDIDFDNEKMTIQSPKTAHHDNHGFRTLPIFPEVLPELNKAWHNLPYGSKTKFVLPKISCKTLTKQLKTILGSLGENDWPQFLVNFRRTARTDKAMQGFAPHILNHWFGHTEEVSHVYLMDTEQAHEQARSQPSSLRSQEKQNNKDVKQ